MNFTKFIQRIQSCPARMRERWQGGSRIRNTLIAASVFAVMAGYLLGVYWSFEPDAFDVNTDNAYVGEGSGRHVVIGYTTANTLIRVAETLLDKPAGFLSNDVMPPSRWLDNMPGWEIGVLAQVRDLARAMRRDMSRSQSQSVEHEDLKIAEPQFNIDRLSWMLPSAEGEYRSGIRALRDYQRKLLDPSMQSSQFYARADNLRGWLDDVSKRLGSLSQRLTASVGQDRVNTDLAGEKATGQSTQPLSNLLVKTPWLEIDDIFYEARGACWALIHFLKAMEVDFGEVLRHKNATASLQQIIRELEATQDAMWSPIVLNGRGFGFVANHSLVMASYISRANAAIIDLRDLLSQG